jgi:hypothetical protein
MFCRAPKNVLGCVRVRLNVLSRARGSAGLREDAITLNVLSRAKECAGLREGAIFCAPDRAGKLKSIVFYGILWYLSLPR